MKFLISSIIVLMSLLSGCSTVGKDQQSNVYDASTVNTEMASEIVEIMLIMPVEIKVDNSENKKKAGKFGAFLGAALGSSKGSGEALLGGVVGAVAGDALTSGDKYMEGVQVTYVLGDITKTTVQVGKLCQFKLGKTLKVMFHSGESRIQPNTQCPKEA